MTDANESVRLLINAWKLMVGRLPDGRIHHADGTARRAIRRADEGRRALTRAGPPFVCYFRPSPRAHSARDVGLMPNSRALPSMSAL